MEQSTVIYLSIFCIPLFLWLAVLLFFFFLKLFCLFLLTVWMWIQGIIGNHFFPWIMVVFDHDDNVDDDDDFLSACGWLDNDWIFLFFVNESEFQHFFLKAAIWATWGQKNFTTHVSKHIQQGQSNIIWSHVSGLSIWVKTTFCCCWEQSWWGQNGKVIKQFNDLKKSKKFCRAAEFGNNSLWICHWSCVHRHVSFIALNKEH